MAEELRLEALGALRIARGDDALTGFVSSKAPALLCYLAVTGRPHSRSSLAALLWTEMPEDDARRSLRVVLANLRQALAPYLRITRETVAFDRASPYWLDVEQFEAALQRDAPDGPPDADRVRAAVALYRGDFLRLPGGVLRAGRARLRRVGDRAARAPPPTRDARVARPRRLSLRAPGLCGGD